MTVTRTEGRGAASPRFAPLIHNPVLRGFHPDPSILRVGADYYLATSTFEWRPGVTIHHSRDLADWTPLGGALGETRLLDLVGTVDSGGVWAPCLSHADGVFYLVYTHMVSNIGPYRDLRNFVVTAPSPTGPWSDPMRLHNRGFDPSFFHDEGRTWMVAMDYDHRPEQDSFAGITLQEWSPEQRRLTGPIRRIFAGTARGCTEGPHLYRRNGWYILLMADGGTGANHGAVAARSRTIEGPYELDPAGPLLTTRDDFDEPSGALDPRLLPLRLHADPSWVDTQARPGHLRLRGQQSLASAHRQSLVAHRQTALNCAARTLLDFHATDPKQMAGLVHFYNTKLWHYLNVSWDEQRGRVLRLGSLDFQTYTESAVVPIEGDAPVHLRARTRASTVRFAWSIDGTEWDEIGPPLDASLLSDEYATRSVAGRITDWGYTGAVFGLAAQDLTGTGLPADFDFLDYREL